MKKIVLFLLLLAGFVLISCKSEEIYYFSGSDGEVMSFDSEVKDSEASSASTGTDIADKQNSIYIHVCGAVGSPGVYELPEGSRIYEAVEAAGGFLDEADTQCVNLARELKDGEQISISKVGEEAAGEDETRVDLNTADVKLLCTVPGIGETRAEAIIAYREKNGSFLSAEELMQVVGIKQGIYEQIAPYVYVK